MLISWIIICGIRFIMVFNILEIVNFTISMATYNNILLNLVIVNILEYTHVYVA